MIQCPECRMMIPDDSAFCDQCGKELKWCPTCRRPKRGTECPVCGTDLVPGRKYLSGDYASSAPSSSPSPSAGPAPSSEQPQPTAAQVIGPSVLAGNGWKLALKEGPFGRRGGIWPELGTCQYVSGNHGMIARAGAGWTIQDVGSTNGTLVNGARLAPNSPVQLKAGDKVRIANLEFIVQ